MWTNAKLNNGQVVASYGLGFDLTPFRGRKCVGHTGGGPGFVAAYTRFIDDKVTVIVLANADREGD
jgi:D-alanyl-D-alanine carboxypeptidase